MPLPVPELGFDLTNHTRDQWFEEMDEVGEEYGYLERLGAEHSALFVDAGPTLLVTFEQIGAIRNRKRSVPRAFDFVTNNNWSVLCLIAEGPTWFRHERVYRFFDRLTDDGFFEDFDQTLFYGNHDCGYAAAAFSVASPGARVLALRPVATLDPSVARWDRRYLNARRLDFTTRYGYAPDMIEASAQTYIMADQTSAADAMHASLFRRPNVESFNTTYAGPRIEHMWDNMDVTTQMIEAAMAGTLDPATFGKLWRGRRNNAAYLKTLLKRVDRAGRTDLGLRLCKWGKGGIAADAFEKYLDDLLMRQVDTA